MIKSTLSLRSIVAVFLAGLMTISLTHQAAAQSVGETMTVYRTTANLRLRSGPSTQAEIIVNVPFGTLVQVLNTRDSNWYSVYVNSLRGYMSSAFLDFVAVRPAGAPLYTAGSVTIMDAQTGEVLYGSAQHQRRFPASLTKIVTALLVLEHVEDLDEHITFSSRAVTLPLYAANMGGISAGDTLTVREALYGIMLPSGNEAANALAEHVAGNIGNFVAQMNQRVNELGATNTRFINPCGLPGVGQYTTSYDMALIMREALQHPIFREIIATPYIYISPTASSQPLLLRNSNLLIQEDAPEFNPRVVGGKTGFTNASQRTLVTYSHVEGHRLIVSILFVPRREGMFSDTALLLEHALTLL